MKKLLLTLGAVLVSTTASADGFNYVKANASYTGISDSGVDLTLAGFGAGFEYEANRLLVGFSFSHLNGSDDGSLTGDLTLRTSSFKLAYEIIDDAYLIGKYNHLKLSDPTNEASTSAYMIGAEYNPNNMSFGVGYNKASDIDEALVSVFGSYRFDETEVYALTAKIDELSGFALGVDHNGDAWDMGAGYINLDGDLDVFAAKVGYEFSPKVRVAGQFAKADLAGASLDFFGVAAGYHIADQAWIDLGAGRLGAEGESATTMWLGLSYEFGQQALSTDRVTSHLTDLLPAGLDSLNF